MHADEHTHGGRWLWVRLEGVLSPNNLLESARWMALQGPSVHDKMRGVLHVAGSLWWTRTHEDALRAAYAGLRGFSEDRLAVLSEDVGVRWRESLTMDGLALLRRLRREHDHLGIITDALDGMVSPLLDALPEVDRLLCHTMELRGGVCTGHVPGPLHHGMEALSAVRRAMDTAPARLADATVVGCSPHDLALLGAAGTARLVTEDHTEHRFERAAGSALSP